MAKKDLLDLSNLTVQEIDGDLSHYSFTITGNGGVGKSTFANALFSRLSDTVVFACEDRFKGIRNVRVVPIKSWSDFSSYKTQLKKILKETGKLPFYNISIDPVGQLGKMCEDYIIEENGVDDIGDIPYGGGYTKFEAEFYGTIKELRDMGINVSFVAHGKNESITPPRQDPYDVQMPDIQKRLKYLVKDEVDFLLYLATVRDRDEDGTPILVRRLYLHGFPEFSLKVPLDGFPEYIEWAGSVEEGVDKFLDAFNRAVEITRSGSGEVVSVIEKKAKKTTPKDTDDTDEEDDELDNLRSKAIEVRDKLLETTSKADVIKLLKEYFETAKISEVDDKDKLSQFIDDNK